MKRYAAMVAVVLLLAGCDVHVSVSGLGPDMLDYRTLPDCPQQVSPYKSLPKAETPTAQRQSNYNGGSCMWASTISVLRYFGLHDEANWWRSHTSGAAGIQDIRRVCDKRGLDYALTTTGDTQFLEWCSRTRRPAAIYYYDNHAVTFAGFTEDGKHAVLIDNNRVRTPDYIERNTFLQYWQGYGGRAITLVYDPPPPRPWTCPYDGKEN